MGNFNLVYNKRNLLLLLMIFQGKENRKKQMNFINTFDGK